MTKTKTVSETDVYLFSGVSQECAPTHLDEVWASRTAAGGRIAQGALALGLMSRMAGSARGGYSRVRFIKPIRIGDVITVSATEEAATDQAPRSVAITARNQDDAVIGAANATWPSGERRAPAVERPIADYDDVVWVSRTISRSDALIFDFVTTGDRAHLLALADEAPPSADPQPAPPELSVGLMAGAATAWEERHGLSGLLSYGYDDVVFHAPLHIGDSIRVGYAKEAEVPGVPRFIARTEALDADGRVVASARHIVWYEA